MKKVNGIYINGKQSYAVFTDDGYGFESAEEANRNIKLFNAANDLLSALTLLYELCSAGQPPGNDDLDMAFSAIKNAT